MDYAELLKSDVCVTDMQKYLSEGEATAITIRILKNLRDVAKESAAMRGTGFSAFVRSCMIEKLTKDI